VQGSDNDFYGTTEFGGTDGNGSVFKVDPDGTFTTLFSITDTNLSYTGEFPCGTLAQGGDGNLYGTTIVGGKTGSGTVFQITPRERSRHCTSLIPNGRTARTPMRDLCLGATAISTGRPRQEGSNSYGDVFRISSAGTFTQLYQFSGPDGLGPRAALVQGCDGSFYGRPTKEGRTAPARYSNSPFPSIPRPIRLARSVGGHQRRHHHLSVWPETYQLQYRDSLTMGVGPMSSTHPLPTALAARRR